ncbi:MAG: glucose-1-phosphate adenylyltransferase [Chlamydiales bacterium]|nr:glucose-1-phosphate adenylyltransferase [Chlamydiales bacterium]
MLVNFFSDTISYETEISSHIPSHVSMDRVAVIILGGGEGKRLAPLTKSRCKPAVSFGGRYSLIDVPISHSLSSGLSKIFVIGQYLAYTLQKHLFQTYLYHGITQNQIQLLVPEEREGKKIWYKGTADAIRQNLEYFSEVSADYFLILSGDQLYNINFKKMIDFAVEVDAGMLIASQPVNRKDAGRMGILKIEHGGSKIINFCEKPKEETVLEQYYTDPFTLNRLGYDGNNGRHYLGSMGIYLFKREVMFDLLREDPRDDFGKHLIKSRLEKGDVHAYLYDGYWEDIGTIESYYNANLALTKEVANRKSGLLCYDERSRIITKRYNLPGVRVSNCRIKESLICEGSIVEGDEVFHSVLGVRTILGKGSVIRDSIVIGNEFYERPPLTRGEESLNPGIGTNCHIERAILDENVTIGDNVTLVNQKGHETYDSPDGLVVVRDGIIIIPRAARIPDNYVF